MYSYDEKQFLLTLARRAIEKYLATGERFSIPTEEVPPALCEPRACLVTLTKNFELRGCMGGTEPRQPLYLNVIDNALAAAFEDDRFYPLTKEDYEQVAVEVSVLSKPEPLVFSSPEDLLSKLTVGVDGVIVEQGGKSAMYLPQVWDGILDKNDFVSSLCLKAGLDPNVWRNQDGVQVSTFRVETISDLTLAKLV